MALEALTLDDLDIDDERSFRHVALYESLKGLLRRDGYRFLVLDEHLGDQSGRDVVEALRAMSVPWRQLPVIACSGSSMGPGGLGAYDDRLPKPVETSFLDAILQRWGPRGACEVGG